MCALTCGFLELIESRVEMSELVNQLLAQIPNDGHQTLLETNDYRIILLTLAEKQGFLLFSDGLSSKEMEVPEKYAAQNRVELCMYLPGYWEPQSSDQRYTWTLDCLRRLVEHGLRDQTWFGPGHTFGIKEYEEGFSEATRMNHLLLTAPLTFQQALNHVVLENVPITVYSVVPLFPEEADYKQAKGALKLISKLQGKGHSDKIDDFRQSILRTRFRLF